MAKSDSVNPKNLAARDRVAIALLPSAGIIHGAMACMDGAAKYGAYNFRDEKIGAMTYIDASMRHLMDWVDGEDVAPDSKVHHLGHVIATCSILLDAIERGYVIDDRPPPGPAPKLLAQMRALLAEKIKAKECAAKAAKEPVVKSGKRRSRKG